MKIDFPKLQLGLLFCLTPPTCPGGIHSVLGCPKSWVRLQACFGVTAMECQNEKRCEKVELFCRVSVFDSCAWPPVKCPSRTTSPECTLLIRVKSFKCTTITRLQILLGICFGSLILEGRVSMWYTIEWSMELVCTFFWLNHLHQDQAPTVFSAQISWRIRKPFKSLNLLAGSTSW